MAITCLFSPELDSLRIWMEEEQDLVRWKTELRVYERVLAVAKKRLISSEDNPWKVATARSEVQRAGVAALHVSIELSSTSLLHR